MSLDEVLDNRQAEPEPGLAARRRPIRLSERLEYMRQKILRHSHPGIGDRELDVGADTPQAQMHGAAVWRELHSVDQKIPHNLLQACGIALG